VLLAAGSTLNRLQSLCERWIQFQEHIYAELPGKQLLRKHFSASHPDDKENCSHLAREQALRVMISDASRRSSQ
jgi:hypothetical protein